MKQTLSNLEINKLFEEGKWISSTNVSAIYSESNDFKYMVSAPIKTFKRATARNKVKRLLRQGIFNIEIKKVNIAFIYKNSIILDEKTITEEIKTIFNRIKI